MPLARLARRARPHQLNGLTLALLVVACTGGAPLLAPRIAESTSNGAVTAAIVGDRVQIGNGLDVPIEYALIEERWLEQGLALHCFGSTGCGVTILPNQTASALISSADHFTPSTTRLVVVWWVHKQVELPPGSAPSTPYKIVLALQ